MNFRIATIDDAAELSAIYSQYIHTAITFEYTLPSVKEFSQRVGSTLKEYPYPVCVESGKICGYACAHRIQAREAYQWGAELSIYLDAAVTSRGIGKKLYSLLIDLLKRQGVRTVYGCVATPNPRSEKLHERLGFRTIGVFRRAGFKAGSWHDVTWFEKSIARYDVPAALIPFPKIAPEEVQKIMASYEI